MAISDSSYAVFLENLEQTITARNIEEYLVENPGPYPLPPDPTYAEWLPVAADQFETMLGTASSVSHADIVTTDSNGLATFTYPSTASPVVAATVVDTTSDTTFYQAALVSVSSTQAVVRVTQNTSTTLLGIALLTVPTNAASVPVHIVVTPTG